MLLLWLAACNQNTLMEWVGWEEVRQDSETVFLSGTVSDGPVAEDFLGLEEGSLDFFDLDGELLAAATQPHSNNLDTWQVELPHSVDYQIRIEGPEAYPALWRGRAPRHSGYWYTGSVFSWPRSTLDPLVESLRADQGMDIAELADGAVSHLWGVALDEEGAVRGLEASQVEVIDGAGESAEIVLALVGEDDGSETPPVFFLAFDLAPGEVEVRVEGTSGEWASTHYLCNGGEVLSPWWFEAP